MLNVFLRYVIIVLYAIVSMKFLFKKKGRFYEEYE